MKPIFDVEHMRRVRSGCARQYAEVSEFQQRLDEELLGRLGLLTIKVHDIAILGAGNAEVAKRLLLLFPQANITVLDISQGMLDNSLADMTDALRANVRAVLCAPHSLPCDSGEFDLVYSNLFVPLCDNVPELFAHVWRVLRPGGCFHFSCLGADSFQELRNAWRTADDNHSDHVIECPDMHDVGDALVGVKFTEPVMDCETFTLTYSGATALFSDLRANGVHNFFVDRRKGLTGKRRWRRFCQALEQGRVDQRLALTLQAVLGQAWRPLIHPQTQLADGSVAISLDGLKRSR